MTLPHQCRCAICGEIGTILPGLPNVFAPQIDTPPEGVERRAIVQKGDPGPHPLETVGIIEPYAPLATCTHGYTRCMICKFPAP